MLPEKNKLALLVVGSRKNRPSRSFRSLSCVALCAALCLCTTSGCTKEPPKRVVVRPPDVPPPPQLKPKPKPKCEKFEENCVATADTQAAISGSEFVFIPPEGWLYAQQSDVTITKTEESNAVMAVLGFEATDDNKTRDQNYEKLVQLLEIKLPEKIKVRYAPTWSKPEASRKSGELEIKLWQTDGAKRAGTSGFLNVLLGTDPGGKKILGIVFTPENDERTADAVNKSLETIGPGSYQ